MHPADEYAQLKSTIRALEARAEALREGFLRQGTTLRSNQVEIVVRRQLRRSFQKDRLPPHILNDPQYWEERASPVVTIRDLTKAAPGPSRAATEAGPQLLEPFD